MRNILISLFILSCFFASSAIAYEGNDAELQGSSNAPAGVKGVNEGFATDHNKTNESLKEANNTKNKEGVFDSGTDDEEAGEEAKDQNKEQTLDKVEEKLVNTAKETEEVEVLEEVNEDLIEEDKKVIEEDEAITPEKK